MNYPNSYPLPHHAQFAATVTEPDDADKQPGPLRADRSIRAFRISMWVFCALALSIVIFTALAM